MHPVIFEIGPIKLHSFGLMVVLAFVAGAWLTVKELRRKEIHPDNFDSYPLLALVGGIVGARLYYLLDHFDRLLRDPVGMIFSGSGLTWYGGALGGAVAVLGWARHKGQRLWAVCDAFSPGLALAYAVGRIGCHLSGDGDYGPPTDLPWGYSYAKGTVPTEPGVLHHPTPLYEVLAMGLATFILWKLRTRLRGDGQLFGIYLVLAGTERFLAEFVRLNDPVAWGLTVAQWSSMAAVALGVSLFLARRPHPARRPA
jgi:phosphatidylglycerol:prolipoprotein diacylglycerol transferase